MLRASSFGGKRDADFFNLFLTHDLVAAFQAFHWFKRTETRAEFDRILRNNRWILIVWNERIADEPGFHLEYESFLKEFLEYRLVDQRNVRPSDIAAFINDPAMVTARLPNSQALDWTGVRGRFVSSSYSPKPESSEYEPSLRRLREIFEKNRVIGRIEIKYNTEVYLGKLA